MDNNQNMNIKNLFKSPAILLSLGAIITGATVYRISLRFSAASIMAHSTFLAIGLIMLLGGILRLKERKRK